MDKNKFFSFGMGLAILVTGLVFKYFGIGSDFFAFGGLGNYLIVISVITVIITSLSAAMVKRRKIDERMMKAAYEAGRISFALIFLACFIIMLWDAIRPIDVSYFTFMGYFMCGILVVYMVVYKIVLRWRL